MEINSSKPNEVVPIPTEDVANALLKRLVDPIVTFKGDERSWNLVEQVMYKGLLVVIGNSGSDLGYGGGGGLWWWR